MTYIIEAGGFDREASDIYIGLGRKQEAGSRESAALSSASFKVKILEVWYRRVRAKQSALRIGFSNRAMTEHYAEVRHSRI